MAGVPIDYEPIVARFVGRGSSRTAGEQLEAYHQFLFDELPDWWSQSYHLMPHDSTEIVEFEDHGVRFLFDLVAERVVVAFGVSEPTQGRRDASRMSGFLGKVNPPSRLASESDTGNSDEVARQQLAGMTFRDRFFLLHGDRYDRGHFISHKQGGGLDVNLFPQRADINQGRSALGRKYRAMERRCARQPGVFCFSRPIYGDRTWVPSELEYGVVEDLQVPEVRVFPN